MSATDGSPTKTGWKRRSSAASFSMCLRYSSSVVAPTQRSSPRASIGLSMFAASTAPSAAPAPTIVCSSSMKRMSLPSAFRISLRTAFSRSSNSPRYFAPASSAPMSSAQTRLPFRPSGTSPSTMRCARPSTIAVLPVPGLADQHRVVLRAAREHLDDAADLLVAADDRVELALLGRLGEVAAELRQRLVRALGILRGDALAAAHRLDLRLELRRAGRRRARAADARSTRSRPACASPRRSALSRTRESCAETVGCCCAPSMRGFARERRLGLRAQRVGVGHELARQLLVEEREQRDARDRARGCRCGAPAPARRRPLPAT